MYKNGEGNGIPLQYSCLENPMNGGAQWAAIHGVAKSQTQLCDFTFTFHFHALEKEMATHSSALAWRIPGMGCRLWGRTESDTTEVTQQQQQTYGLDLVLDQIYQQLQKANMVGHQGGLACCSAWGCKELDTTE